MATAASTTDRQPAIRFLSDQVVSTRIASLAFDLEALTDGGPFGVPAGGAPRALAIARQLEELAGETAAERPAIARTLRTAAGDLRRGAEANSPAAAFAGLTDGLRLLEQL